MATLTLGRVMIAYGADVKQFQSGSRKVTKELDKQKRKSKDTGSAVGGLKANYLVAAAGMAAIVSGGKKALEAWSNQEDAVNKLNIALANQANFTPEVSRALQEQASALQAVTRFGDEATIAGQAMLATSGLTGKEITRATPLVLDFATAMGMDVNTAFQLVTKAAAGQASALSRYGISVTKGKSDSEQFEEVLVGLEHRFSGMAEMAGTTASGKMEMFSNAVGDVWEQLGKFTEFILGGFGISMESLIEKVQRVGTFFGQDLPIAFGIVRQGFANMISFVLDGVNVMIGSLAKNFETLNNLPGLNHLVPDGFVEKLRSVHTETAQFATALRSAGEELYNEAVAAAAAGPGNEEMAKKVQAAAAAADDLADGQAGVNKEVVNGYSLMYDYITQLNKMTEEEILAKEIQETVFTDMAANQQNWGTIVTGVGDLVHANRKKVEEAEKRLGLTTRAEAAATEAALVQSLHILTAEYGAYSAQAIAAQTALDEFRKESTNATHMEMMSSFETLASGLDSAFAAMGSKFKGFAIAQAIISTYLAIAKAMTTLPWPANLISAAGAAAAGFANVAKIRASNATSARFGTPALDFQNFGAESPAFLHGNEAVVPQGSGHRLANEIARAMPTSMTESSGGGGDGEMVIRIPVVIDGKQIDELVERRTKTGNMRVHENSVRDF